MKRGYKVRWRCLSMSKDKQPEIRFPGFTEDWEQCLLGETLKDLKSGLSRMLSNDDIGLPVVRANNINDGQFDMINDVKYWYENDPQGAKTENYLVHKNDILINFINSEAKMGTATIVQDEPERKTIYTTNILKAQVADNFDADFWFALTQTYRYKIDIKMITKPAVNQASFTTVDFKKLSYPFPAYDEQVKIGSFFKNLDHLITLHQRKLDLLKETKKGFLQKMFPKNGAKVPEIRFPGFTEDWEQRKLGDLTTWTKGQGLTKEDLNKERDGSEAVHYADLYKFSPVMHEVIHWTNSDDGRIIPDNSLLFPASDVTPVGLARTSTLRLSGVKAGGDVIIGQLNESINSSFMSYQINANSKKILPLITGTTVKHIQAKSLATVSVSITNMAEQTAIAGIFEQLDDTITLHQRKLDLLKETKKGFLQKMFV
ncbi:restriction endonuclease subunit S [Enterococcus faecium]|nr:restriction endonuclease subunit S [Enterococcus faecium]